MAGQVDAEWLTRLADYVTIAVRSTQEFELRAQQPPSQPSAERKNELEEAGRELMAAVERIDRLAEP